MCSYRLFGPVILFVVLMSGTAHAWRSSLFPENWQPGYADTDGRFLHDFSYAGYHYGRVLPGSITGSVVDVRDHGADATGATDATAAIQAAIDAVSAAGGGVVRLPAGLYRCDGELRVQHSGVVLRGDGPESTQVYFTKYLAMEGRSHVLFTGGLTQGAEFSLAEDGVNGTTRVSVMNATGLSVGDEVSLGWIITDDFVAEHAMTGTWYVFNGQWRPVFRREITAIDTSVSPNVVTLDVPLRYPAKLRDGASLRRETGYLSECGLEDLALANAVTYADAWLNEREHCVVFQYARDCWIRNVHSFPSPLSDPAGYHLQNSGFRIWGAKRFTIADCRLEKAQNRGSGGCGYLYEIGASNEVLIRDCVGLDGRHNFIQNWDFGTTGCVFLRCSSAGGRVLTSPTSSIGVTGLCEFHHSLSMACLIDSCMLDDGWYGGNRGSESSGAGHTVTQSAYWNTTGAGRIRSYQFGNGYIIGTGPTLELYTALGGAPGAGTDPEDYIEGAGQAATLEPQSLYEAQLLARKEREAGGYAGCVKPPSGFYEVGEDLCLVVPEPVSAYSAYMWRRNGAPLPDEPRVIGADDRKLLIVSLVEEDSGVYTCTYDDGSKAEAVYTVHVTVVPNVPALPVPLFPAR